MARHESVRRPPQPRPLRLARALACAASLVGVCRAGDAPAALERPGTELARRLLREPAQSDWQRLSQYGGTLTRAQFEARLRDVFDPYGGMDRYLRVTDEGVEVLPAEHANTEPVLVSFARPGFARRSLPEGFRTPAEFRGRPAGQGPPLSGLRIAIEPADIGGAWAKMEDRSAYFAGYGRINEGDLNLEVARILEERLKDMGASVFPVRYRAEPVTSVRPADLMALVGPLLHTRPNLFPEAFWIRDRAGFKDPAQRLAAAAELLFTKTIETRARAQLLRREFRPDLTIVLQHNATAGSASGQLAEVNRNIFFVEGAYAPDELRDPESRLRMLTKLLGDVTPTEVAVAQRIAQAFKEATGYPPVLYHDTESTRLLVRGDPYVVARNLAFNRMHDGPVVVTEPYFMNQSETLARLLAGDYPGRREVAGRPRVSIFREYADAVAKGILEAYGPAGGRGR